MQSSLCANQRTIVFACAVRSGGTANGVPVGVLAVVFRWDALAQVIVEATPLSTSEWEQTRVYIVDRQARLLADSASEFGEVLNVPCWREIHSSNGGHRMVTIDSESHCLGHAKSLGYETYGTGWYSLILQKDDAV